MRRRRTDENTHSRTRLGRRGERAAEKFLRRAGLIVLARNWRGGGGELDLALLEGETLIFVEVKTRTAGFDDPRLPVSVPQRRRIRMAARAFRRRYGVTDLPTRFDLVSVSFGAQTSTHWQKNYQRNDEQQEPR